MKTLVDFYFLLMLSAARGTNDQTFETRTVGVGKDVELNCPCEGSGSLYWIRLGSEKSPEYLGKTNSLQNQGRRSTITERHGGFVLLITRAEVEDTGLYFCFKTYKHNLTFLKRINLTVEGKFIDLTKESGFNVPAVKPVTAAVPTPDPVRPGEPKKTCPEEHSVCCLGAGSHSGLNSIQGIIVNLTGSSTKKCNCTFFRNSSCGDDGAYFCAVDTCEEMKPENGFNQEEKAGEDNSQTNIPVLHLLIAALVICLIVIAFLLYTVRNLKKQHSGCNKAGVPLQSELETARSDQQNQQAEEDSLIYSAPTFIKRNSSIAGVKAVRQAEEESIYADVRVPERERD